MGSDLFCTFTNLFPKVSGLLINPKMNRPANLFILSALLTKQRQGDLFGLLFRYNNYIFRGLNVLIPIDYLLKTTHMSWCRFIVFSKARISKNAISTFNKMVKTLYKPQP